MSLVLALSSGDTRKHVALGNLRARLDRENGVDRQQEAGVATARQLQDARRSCP